MPTHPSRAPTLPLLPLLVVGLAALVVARHVPTLGWPLEVLGNFPLHLALIGVVLAVPLAAGRQLRWAIAALVVSAIAAMPALRLLTTPPTAQSTQPGLRVSLHNVLSTNPTPERTIAEIRETDADVVVLLEVTDAWTPLLESLRPELPFQHIEARPDNFGIAALSRLPLEDLSVLELGEAGGFVAPALRFEVAHDGEAVQMVGVHLFPPIGARGAELRALQVAQLAVRLGDATQPTILLGDLNTGPTTHTHHVLSAATGLRTLRAGRAWWATWPAQLPGPLGIPIDDILLSKQLTVRAAGVGGDTGSDHRALHADVARAGEAARAPR